MTWTAPQPEPPGFEPLTGPDRPMLEAFLADQRRTLLSICAGLTGEQLALRPIPSSSLSLLGLVRHLAKVERTWFRERAAGEAHAPMYDEAAYGKDADFIDLDPSRAEADFARFREERRLADEVARELPFDHEFSRHGEVMSLRLVYVHVTTEYARHNGHADVLRELIDGVTGR
jgi:uncharacterized damage-inducible protein DinB